MVELTEEGTVAFIDGLEDAERVVWVSAYTGHLLRVPIARTADAQYAVATANQAVHLLREALARGSTVEPITGGDQDE